MVCTDSTQTKGAQMAFVVDKEELKPGLILFRRADVDRNNWYWETPQVASASGRSTS
jgi:hypothetical protein